MLNPRLAFGLCSFLTAGGLWLACAPSGALPSAGAQDNPARSYAEQQKRENALGHSVGSGMALSCYTSLQHIGDLAEQVQGGKEPGSILQKATVALKLLEGYGESLDKAATVLGGSDEKEFRQLATMVSGSKDSAAALVAYSGDPSAENAKAFREAHAKAWAGLSRTFGWDETVGQALRPGGFELQGR